MRISLATSVIAAVGASLVCTGTTAPSATAAVSPDGVYVGLPTAQRMLDTRLPQSAGNGFGRPLSTGDKVTVNVAQKLGQKPGQVRAIMVTTTAVSPAANGWLTVQPGTGVPTTSTLNFSTSNNIANTTVVPVAADGTVTVYEGAGRNDVLLDVVGWFNGSAALPAGTSGQLADVTDPYRVYDTRSGAALKSGSTAKFTIDLPYAGATLSSVLVQLTAVPSSGYGWLTAWSGAGTMPWVSNLNFNAGQNVANFATVPVTKRTDGKYEFAITVGGSGSTHLLIDSIGFTSPSGSAFGGSRYRTVNPVRMLDTRFGPAKGWIAKESSKSFSVGSAVTSSTTAVVGNAAILGGVSPGWALAWSGGQPKGTASTLQFGANKIRASGVVAVPSAGNILSMHNGALASVNALFDVSGTFEVAAQSTVAKAAKRWTVTRAR